MTERLHRPRISPRRTAFRGTPHVPAGDVSDDATFPTLPPAPAEDGPTIVGLPPDADDQTVEADETVEADQIVEPEGTIVVLRRADRFGCAVLVLAGAAANVSLSLPWLPDDETTGLSLVWLGVDLLADGSGDLVATGLWQPLTVVLGGLLLVVLGLLVLIPARSHRVLGVLALLVALATAAAVLVLLTRAEWQADRFSVGMWFAVAVPVLGVLGALKAMLTPPHVTIGPP